MVNRRLPKFRVVKVFRFNHTIPADTFIDPQQGNTRNLSLYLYQKNGQPIPKDNWLNLYPASQSVIAYLTMEMYINQYSYEYTLTAVDNTGHEASIPLNITIDGNPPPENGNYIFKMQLLSSSSMVLNIYNNVELLFYIHTKMAPFLRVQVSQFINYNYNVKLSGSISEIDYTWSLTSFTGPDCNINAIIDIRNKIMSDNGMHFKQIFRPQFTLNLTTERFVGPCSYLSGDTPIIKFASSIKSVQVGRYFFYRIPQDAFLSPSGSNMNLRLQLRFSNGTNVPSKYWMRLNGEYSNETSKIEGVPTVTVARKQQTYSFMLVAITPLMVESSTTIEFTIRSERITSYPYIITMVQNFVSQMNYVTFVQSFVRYMSSYLVIPSSWIMIIDYQTSSSSTTMVWTITNLTSDPCNTEKLSEITSKLVLKDGSVNQTLRNGLSSKTGFLPNMVSVRTFGICDLPSIRLVIPPLYIPKYGTLNYTIPSDMFYDPTDGYKVKLSLLTENGQPLPENSWITFSSMTRTISGIPLTDSLQSSGNRYFYTIRATDRNGSSVDQRISVSVNWTAPQWSLRFWTSMSYNATTLQQSGIILSFINKLKAFLKDTGKNDIIVNKATFLSSTKTVTIFWQNTALRFDPCDTSGKMSVLQNLRKDVSGTAPSASFSTFLQSHFRVTEVGEETKGPCLPELTTSPKIINRIPELFLRYCGYLKYEIPQDTFHDSIDGYTRNLSLSLTKLNGSLIGNDEWIHFDSQAQTITAVIYDSLFSNHLTTSQSFSFKLTALNKRGFNVTENVTLTLNEAHPNSSFYFIFNVMWQLNQNSYQAEALSILMDKISFYFQGQISQLHYLAVERNPNFKEYFAVKLSNCTLQYDPCDRAALESLKMRVFVTGGVNPLLISTLGPHFYLLTAQGIATGPCQIKSMPPRVLHPIGTLYAYPCSNITYSIPRNAFYDEEDGTNLPIAVTKINGLGITSGIYVWLGVVASTKTLYAVITNEVVAKQPAGGYNITLSATDSSSQYVEMNFKIKIVSSSNTLPHFYKASLHLTLKASGFRNKGFEENIIVTAINSYFSANVTNIVSYSLTSQARKEFTVTWSLCTLPNRCDKIEADAIYKRMLTSQNTILPQFSQALSFRYTIRSITKIIDPICTGPINPPVPSLTEWTIQGSYCGGFRVQTPEDLFHDPEDGNTRTLSLTLRTVGSTTNLHTSYNWIRLNSTSQVLYGTPTRDQAIEYKSKPLNLTLVAIDRTGLEGTLPIKFSFVSFPKPSYKFKIRYTPDFVFNSDADEIQVFMQKISSFLNQATLTSFGLLSFDKTGNSRYITYGNCSVTYNPCDLAALKIIRATLFQRTGLPQGRFTNAMQPLFRINWGLIRMEGSCSETQTNPPRVINPIKVLNISVCSSFSFKIPSNVFYDTEDGDTGKLRLALVTNDNIGIAPSSWIQFNQSSQLLTSVAMASFATSQPTVGFSYILTAIDSSDLSTSNIFKVKLIGPAKVLTECQIQTEFASQLSITNTNNVDLANTIISKLVSYFALSSREEIGVVSLVRHDSFRFMFAWSYCSPLYKSITYEQSSSVNIDFHGFVTKIMMKLYDSNTKTIRSAFYHAFDRFTVAKVTRVFTGRCANFPPVVTLNTQPLALSVGNCGYRKVSVQKDWFYDLEEGTAHSLSLSVLSASNMSVALDSWINLNSTSNEILITLQDSQRFASSVSFTYYLQAFDSKMQAAKFPLVITKAQISTASSPFNITFEYLYKGPTAIPFVSQSIDLMDKISSYYSLMNNQGIILKSFTKGHGISYSRVMEWTTCSTETCSSSVLIRTRGLSSISAGLVDSVKEAFLPLFEIKRIHYTDSCMRPNDPPSNPQTIPILNVTYCSLFRYQLPISLFVDRKDGDIRNLGLRLLDENENQVPPTSWIQLNTATMELYAVGMKHLQDPKTNYRIEATNSGGLKSYTSFKANVINYPYTSDCYSTLDVKLKAGFHLSNQADLDVLVMLLERIRQYYGDTNMKMKVASFTRITDKIYRLKYSNCSFVFSSLSKALNGLDESYRPGLTAIFSRIVQSNGLPRIEIKRYLSTYFDLLNATVSYTCIEKPPSTVSSYSLFAYGYICEEFCYQVPETVFFDKRDGNTRNMKLSLHYSDGNPVSLNEWLYLDPESQNICGIVTENVKYTEPSAGFEYVIVATDSSGRSSNVTFKVKIANNIPNIPVRFVMGFNNTLNYYTPAAKVLLNITRKLATYLDPTDTWTKILVHSYQPPNKLTWSYCPISCSSAYMTQIMTKLQKTLYYPDPSQQFITSLQPEFKIYYVYINNLNCGSVVDIRITVNSPPLYNQRVCGLFSFTIPQNTFSDSFTRTTRDFLLELYSTSGKVIGRESYIQLDSTRQGLTGIPVVSEIRSSVQYTLKAYHPVSRSTAITRLTLNFPNYKFLSSLRFVCKITVTMTTKYYSTFDNLYVLKQILQKMSGYFSVSTGQFQVTSFTRITYKNPEIISFTFANCSWFQLMQTPIDTDVYYRQVQLTLNKLLQYSGSNSFYYKQELYQAFQPYFTLTNVTTSSFCSPASNTPPRPNKTLNEILIPSCGEFKYQIPEDFFMDEDGNTRNLKVDLLQIDGSELPTSSWVVFDTNKQMMSGLPSSLIAANQPLIGYSYIIRATDKMGLNTSVHFKIKLEGKPSRTRNFGISFAAATSQIDKYPMNILLAFTRKLSTFTSIKQFYIYQQQISQVGSAGTNLFLKIASCSSCDPTILLKFGSLLQNSATFQNYIKPSFNVLSISPEELGNKCDEESVLSRGSLQVPMCSKFATDISKIVNVTNIRPSWEVIIRGADFTPLPKTTWFWFDKTSNLFEVFPSLNAWQSLVHNEIGFTWAVVRRSDQQLITGKVSSNIKLVGTPPTSGIRYNLSLSTTHSNDNIDAYFISIIWKSLESYLGRSDFQYISLTRKPGSLLSLRYSWITCGLPSNCDSINVKNFEDKIFKEYGVLRSEFKMSFRYGFNATSVESNCQNKPPEIRIKNINLTIPICGLYKYKLPKNFAYDAEDGDTDNLSVFLRMQDGKMLPQDSWLRLNATSKEIYAFPPESVANSPLPNGRRYTLIVQDKNGIQRNTTLRVFVGKDKKHYYSFGMTFQSLMGPDTPYLNMQVRIMTLISSFVGINTLDSYRVLTLTKLDNTWDQFYMKWANCSTNEYICVNNKHAVSKVEAMIRLPNGKPTNAFVIHSSKYFKFSFIRTEVSYSLDQPPKTVSQMGFISITTCQMYVKDSISAMFYDAQDGGTTLRLSLTFSDNTYIPPNFWVQVIDNKLYVLPYGNAQSGFYTFTLIATDRCGQSAGMNFTVQLQNSNPKLAYQVKVTSVFKRSEVPDIYAIYRFVSKLQLAFKSNQYSLRIINYSIKQTQLQLTWGNCSIMYSPCDRVSIQRLQNSLFVVPNIVNPQLAKTFAPEFNISNVTDALSENCIPSSVSNRSLWLNISLCQKINFKIPLENFLSKENQETAAKISLFLLDGNRKALNNADWIQLDEASRVIYGYPRIPAGDRNLRRNYTYILNAVYTNGKTVSVPVYVFINGNLPSTTYRLRLSGRTSVSNTVPNVAQEIKLIEMIGSYFGDFSINDISFTRQHDFIIFDWSFCNMSSAKCECSYIERVRQKLRSFELFKQHMLRNYTSISVTEEMMGVCSKKQFTQLKTNVRDILVYTGQPFSYAIPTNKKQNLSLYIDNSAVGVNGNDLIRIQRSRFCGLLTIAESERREWKDVSSRKYRLLSQDSCGMNLGYPFSVTVDQYQQLTYIVYVALNVSHDSLERNCSHMESFVEQIAIYVQVNETDIFIYNISRYSNASMNASVIAWGIRELTDRNCNSETIKRIRSLFLTENQTINPSFLKHMKTQYTVIEVDAKKTSRCYNATILPLFASDTKFPWWILILILILALLFFLLWLCWICIPRCCPGCCAACCGRLCGCCNSCCAPGGKYASLDEGKGLAPLTAEEEDTQGGVMAQPGEKNSESSNFENVPDDPSEDKGPVPNDEMTESMALAPNPLEMNLDTDDSSGFKDDNLSDRSSLAPTEYRPDSADSGISSRRVNDTVISDQKLPMNFLSLPPPAVPPLYSGSFTDISNASLIDDASSVSDRSAGIMPSFGDFAGKPASNENNNNSSSAPQTEEVFLEAKSVSMAESAAHLSRQLSISSDDQVYSSASKNSSPQMQYPGNLILPSIDSSSMKAQSRRMPAVTTQSPKVSVVNLPRDHMIANDTDQQKSVIENNVVHITRPSGQGRIPVMLQYSPSIVTTGQFDIVTSSPRYSQSFASENYDNNQNYYSDNESLGKSNMRQAKNNYRYYSGSKSGNLSGDTPTRFKSSRHNEILLTNQRISRSIDKGMAPSEPMLMRTVSGYHSDENQDYFTGLRSKRFRNSQRQRSKSVGSHFIIRERSPSQSRIQRKSVGDLLMESGKYLDKNNASGRRLSTWRQGSARNIQVVESRRLV